MKTEKKKIKITSLSIPEDLLEKADRKAAERYQKRSEYIRDLIFFDLQLATVSNQTKKARVERG